MSSWVASGLTPRVSYGSSVPVAAPPSPSVGGAPSGASGGRGSKSLICSPAAPRPGHGALQGGTSRFPRVPLPFARASSRSPCAPETALVAAPLVDLRVVPGEQHLRDVPAAELGRARVVRVLEPALELGREALDARRLFASRCLRQ